MKTYEYKQGDKPANRRKCVIALGLFDGIHKGHAALFEKASRIAEKENMPFVIFTFRDKKGALKGGERLFTDDEREAILEKTQAEELIVAEFQDMASISAEDFVSNVLCKDLNAAVAVTGTDFRFGKERLGDTELLSQVMSKYGARAVAIDTVAAGEEKISSAMIKNLIRQGELKRAGELLLEPYFIEAKGERGIGLGSKLGVPTVNISLQKGKLVPKHGVYAAAVKIDDKFYTGLTNIGTCPTFGEREMHTETFILDFSGVLYGKRVRIYLLEYLREERRFSGADELLLQIEIDIDKTKRITEALKWQELGTNSRF